MSGNPGVHRPNCELLSASEINNLKVRTHLHSSNRTHRAFVAPEETPRIRPSQVNSSKKTGGCSSNLRTTRQVSGEKTGKLRGIDASNRHCGPPSPETRKAVLGRATARLRTARGHTAASGCSRLRENLLLVSLALQQLPLLVLPHLLAALLDHAAHDMTPSISACRAESAEV